MSTSNIACQTFLASAFAAVGRGMSQAYGHLNGGEKRWLDAAHGILVREMSSDQVDRAALRVCESLMTPSVGQLPFGPTYFKEMRITNEPHRVGPCMASGGRFEDRKTSNGPAVLPSGGCGALELS